MTIPKPVLIIEDQPNFRRWLQEAIQQLDHTIVEPAYEAADGGSALETCDRVKPQLVLLDIMLGTEDGTKLIPEILLASPGCKIVLVTTTHAEVTEADAITAGAVGLIVKYSMGPAKFVKHFIEDFQALFALAGQQQAERPVKEDQAEKGKKKARTITGQRYSLPALRVEAEKDRHSDWYRQIPVPQRKKPEADPVAQPGKPHPVTGPMPAATAAPPGVTAPPATRATPLVCYPAATRTHLLADEFVAIVRERLERDVQGRLDELVKTFGHDPAGLAQAVAGRGLLSAADTRKIWAGCFDSEFPYRDPQSWSITSTAVQCLSLPDAKRLNIMGLTLVEGTFTFAIESPCIALIDQLSSLLPFTVTRLEPVVALRDEIRATIRSRYRLEYGDTEGVKVLRQRERLLAGDIRTVETRLNLLDAELLGADFVDEVIDAALKESASDIHCEVEGEVARLRFRVDGALRLICRYPLKLHCKLVGQIKNRRKDGNDPANVHVPHDFRIEVEGQRGPVHLRVSTIPCGPELEKVVLRILPDGFDTLQNLKISRHVLDPLTEVLEQPHGIVILVGPTGSGKTTTLYAALQQINHIGVSIATVEDPVEVRLPGICQTQVNAAQMVDKDQPLDFAAVLKSLLRQDPDIILVGEIRDEETAKTAVNAALTGHLVLTTLHASSAPQAFTRLKELGVPSAALAPAVRAVISQRLAPRLCYSCREEYRASPDELAAYFDPVPEGSEPFYSPVTGGDCLVCKGRGFKGRVGVHEILLITEKIRECIAAGGGAVEIEKIAEQQGSYRPLRYDALKKAVLKLIPLDGVDEVS